MPNQAGFAGRWPILDQGLLNPELDWQAVRNDILATGRARIDNALRPEIAEFLREVLETRPIWSIAFRQGGKEQKMTEQRWQAMPTAERKQLEDRIVDEAREGFQFRYRSYMMITGYLNDDMPDLPLHRVVELVNRRDWLDPLTFAIGVNVLRRANCQATLYRPGDFLTLHNDFSDQESRQAAYVINLSRDWKADWGGLLQFCNPDGEVIDTFVPRFNSISLFKTPALHLVSPVADFAAGSRAAITGWLLDR